MRSHSYVFACLVNHSFRFCINLILNQFPLDFLVLMFYLLRSIWFQTYYFPLIFCFSWFLIADFKQILFPRFPGSQGQGEVVICPPGILYLILDKLINSSAVQTNLEEKSTFTFALSFPFNLQILNISSNPQILQIIPPSLRKEAWKYLFAKTVNYPARF